MTSSFTPACFLPARVAQLYSNPGSIAVPQDFNLALNTTNLTWTTSGDTSWFVETTNTHDGFSAAQSGTVTNYQSSTLSLTVTGPGTLTFYWASQDDCTDFDYEFDIDGYYADDISCGTAWYQDGPFAIPAGQHTLSWTAYANGDTDPTEAGFLDQVSYVIDTAPVITLNPFNQTNYPGYNVALLAAATNAGNATITWQWFKVGGASPIPNATNALFIPPIPARRASREVITPWRARPAARPPRPRLGQFRERAAAARLVARLEIPLRRCGRVHFYQGLLRRLRGGFGGRHLRRRLVYRKHGCPHQWQHCEYSHGGWNQRRGRAGQTCRQWQCALGRWPDQQPASQLQLWPIAVAAAPGNGAYLASVISGTNWLGTNKFVDAGGGSILLSRFDASGSNVWSQAHRRDQF